MPVSPKTNFPAFLLICFAIALVIALFGFLLITRNNISKENGTGKVTSSVKVGSVEVLINDNVFEPNEVHLKKGGQIVWTNKGSNSHQIASDPHPQHDILPGLSSEVLSSGDSYTFIFEKAGKFSYHDHLNPLTIKGVVIVE